MNQFSPRACRSVFCYEMISRSGEGTYGVVFKAREKSSGKLVALKQVKVSKNLCRQGFPITTLREISVLLALGNHKGIVGVIEVVTEEIDEDAEAEAYGPYKAYMVMDYWEHELKELMQSKPEPFSQSEVKCLMHQLLQALTFIHANFYIHRDLKTSNILYNNDGRVGICDFGLARRYEANPTSKYTDLVVTLHYRAPELLLGAATYGPAIDIWSMGCIFAELLQNKVLFQGRGEIEQLDLIFKLLGTPTVESWPEVSKTKFWGRTKFVKMNIQSKLSKLFPPTSVTSGPYLSTTGVDLLAKMLTLNPEKRISAKEALQHEWFKEFPPPMKLEAMPKFYSHYKRSETGQTKQQSKPSGLFANASDIRM